MNQLHALADTLQDLSRWNAFRLRLFFEGIVVGIAGGFTIGSFIWALDESSEIRRHIFSTYIEPALSNGDVIPFCAWLIFAVFLAYIVYRLCVHETMAMGGGIPQVKGELLGYFHMRWLPVLYVKFSAMVLGILGGLSIGREAPSVQIGAAVAKGISRILKRVPLEERYLITSGSSAGLAAAFSAPLAGTVFALEEMNQSFSSALLLPSMASAVSATIVTRYVFGQEGIFIFPPIPATTHLLILPLILAGAICGPLGVFYNYGLTHVGRFYNAIHLKGVFPRLLFAFILGAFVCLALPQITEGGDGLVNSIVDKHPTLSMLLVLFAGKYLFTVLSTGSGIPGGFLVPMFSIGALVGAIESNIFISLGIIDPMYGTNIITAAMAAFVTASMRSPITSVLLILELTGDFSHLTALVLTAAIAYVTSALVGGKPIYGQLLAISLKNRKQPAKETRTILEIPICPGSYLSGKKIEDIHWPACCTLIDVRQNEQAHIPQPDLVLKPGMHLYVYALPKDGTKLLHLGRS